MIIEKNSIEVYGVNNDTLECIKNIMDSEKMCGFKDAINIAVANQFGCVCFCTLDYKISEKTLRESGMKKICAFKQGGK